MTRVRLEREEAEQSDLPAVCMRCGAPADASVAKAFAWHPPWVILLLFLGLIPFIIVALIMTKRMRVRAPMCAAHRRHWSGRSLIVLVSILVLAGIVVGGSMLAANAEPGGPPGRDFGTWLCAASVLALIGWLLLVTVLHLTSIRAGVITERDITLIGVSTAFREAIRIDRHSREERGREHWEAAKEHFRLPEARRGGPPLDAYQEGEP